MKKYSKLNLPDHHSECRRDLDDLEANDNELKGVYYTGISLIALVIVAIISIGFLVL